MGVHRRALAFKLSLIALLAAAAPSACSEPRAPTIATPIDISPPDGDRAPVATAPTAAPESSACANDEGAEVACPSLDGVTCNAAAYPAGCMTKDVPFRKRSLSAYRSCIATLPKGGDIQACFRSYQACVRDAFDAACVEPEIAAQCERIIASCRAHGATPSFDASGCAHILGALEPTLRADTAARLENDQNPANARCSRVWILPGFPSTPFFPN